MLLCRVALALINGNEMGVKVEAFTRTINTTIALTDHLFNGIHSFLLNKLHRLEFTTSIVHTYIFNIGKVIVYKIFICFWDGFLKVIAH